MTLTARITSRFSRGAFTIAAVLAAAALAALLLLLLLAGAAGASASGVNPLPGSTGPVIANVGQQMSAHHWHHEVYQNRLARQNALLPEPVYPGSEPSPGIYVANVGQQMSAHHRHHVVYENRLASGLS